MPHKIVEGYMCLKHGKQHYYKNTISSTTLKYSKHYLSAKDRLITRKQNKQKQLVKSYTSNFLVNSRLTSWLLHTEALNEIGFKDT